MIKRLKVWLLPGLMLMPSILYAQNWDTICNSPEYVYGVGTGATFDEADKRALADLTTQISVFVQSDFEMTTTNRQEGQSVSSSQYAAQRMKTYSLATLNNVDRIQLAEAPVYRVGRWMKKSEVDLLFKLRLDKARDMVSTAMKAEAESRVDEALRQYYWAYLLTQSLRYPSKADYTDDDGQRHLLMVWLPERMRALMDNVDCSMVGREGDDIEVAFTLGGKPVASLDFTYYDGRDWMPVTSASSGRGLMEMAEGYTAPTLQLRLEYEFRDEAHIDRELQGVMDAVNASAFPKASKTFRAQANPSQSVPTPNRYPTSHRVSDGTTAFELKAPAALTDDKAYAATMQRVLEAIRAHRLEGLESCMTTEGFDIFQRLLNRGKVHIVGTPQPVFHRSADGVVCRGVQMAFSPQNSLRKSFVEDVIFTFDTAARIKNISFGLGEVAERDILCKGIWDEPVRVAIMQFLENYKTAYALKRLDYISTLFDDNAVIITGSVVRNTGQRAMQLDTDSRRFSQRDVRYTRQTKEQYIRNLRRCFQGNEFVSVRFSSNDVVKQGKGGELYSIQIEQDYYSTSYGDHGYLFLMVDLNDAAHPLIKVRTWQPDKDPNFGLYGSGDFKL